MYELVPVGAQSYYINAPVKIGVYRANETEVYVIDSGNDKEAGKKIRKLCEQHHWKLKAIINTHSHADHIGGNQYLQHTTGCTVYGYGMEGGFIQYPILEPAFLYGAYPCKDMRHKFLLAAESTVTASTRLEKNSFPEELEIIELPGHAFQMIGIRTPDNTVFLADSISSAETLEKYKITFIYDVERYLQTLTMLETLEAARFVPAHAEASSDIKPLIALNRAAVLEISQKIIAICAAPINFDKIVQALFSAYGLSMHLEQYLVVGSTIRSYLSWLKDTGKLAILFKDNTLWWCSSL
ncbi:MAG: MBL fold metallo-hydrolase [Treponema sp.]|jgi:glyoxylase-like metal-dependent hydrolase (beta-lactamase superfamily II)|nr:MBL fold metallo-hydrolase [Treponema sp.]